MWIGTWRLSMNIARLPRDFPLAIVILLALLAHARTSLAQDQTTRSLRLADNFPPSGKLRTAGAARIFRVLVRGLTGISTGGWRLKRKSTISRSMLRRNS